MQTKSPALQRSFIHLKHAWYAEATLKCSDYDDEIMLGLYHPDGSCFAELSIRWFPLQSHRAPRLEAFDDSWVLFQDFQDVLSALAELHGSSTSPERICKMLMRLGFLDKTPRPKEVRS